MRSRDVPPVKRDTKSKGDISELRVAVELTGIGYSVSKPLGENQRYDLIADDGERRRDDVQLLQYARPSADRQFGDATVHRADRVARRVLPGEREGVRDPRSAINADENPASSRSTSE
jgi:hypothetical protein